MSVRAGKGAIMAGAYFPYGNDLNKPSDWLGRTSTKSREWMVAYDGSFAIVCGYHSFIFFGLESLHIGIVNLLNCGYSVSLPVGKLLQQLGSTTKTAKRVDQLNEVAGNSKKVGDVAEMEAEQDKIGSGMQLYRRLQERTPTLINARVPFSLDDLWGTSGNILGAEVELYGAAAGYAIDAASFKTGAQLFGPSVVVNMGTGLVAAGASLATGFWSVEKSFDLYHELGSSATRRCQVENQSPAYDQPYRALGNLHPYLSELPPAGCSFTEAGFNPSRFVR